jgi:hypothetical protein
MNSPHARLLSILIWLPVGTVWLSCCWATVTGRGTGSRQAGSLATLAGGAAVDAFNSTTAALQFTESLAWIPPQRLLCPGVDGIRFLIAHGIHDRAGRSPACIEPRARRYAASS